MLDAVEVIRAPGRAMGSVAGGRKVGLGAGVVASLGIKWDSGRKKKRSVLKKL